MDGKEKNTFGNYEFPEWVPENTRNEIRRFWGCFGRTYKDWIEDAKRFESETCSHVPFSGFKSPPFGATVEFIVRDYLASKEKDRDLYKIVRGRFLHAWNNIGRLVTECGGVVVVSTCDRWVRVYDGEKK